MVVTRVKLRRAFNESHIRRYAPPAARRFPFGGRRQKRGILLHDVKHRLKAPAFRVVTGFQYDGLRRPPFRHAEFVRDDERQRHGTDKVREQPACQRQNRRQRPFFRRQNHGLPHQKRLADKKRDRRRPSRERPGKRGLRECEPHAAVPGRRQHRFRRQLLPRTEVKTHIG